MGAISTASSVELSKEFPNNVAMKFDSGKTPYDLLPLDLLDGTARVFKGGEGKYGVDNYRSNGGFDPRRPLAAILRHMSEVQRAIITGDQERMIDKDFGEAHLHHAICSALILIDSLRQRGWNI
jgi:hypothetical protein